MTLASGTSVRTGYVVESTHGTTPASPTLLELRATQRNINLQKNMLETQEVRSSRQKADVRHGFNQVLGTYGFELALQDYDDMLQGAVSGTWAAVNITGGPTLAVNAAASGTATITRSAGSFITDLIRPGDWVITALFSDALNNGTWLVLSVTALVVTVYDPNNTMVTESADADATLQIHGKRLDVGTTLRTFSIERQFQDVSQYQLFRGVALNQMTLNIAPEAMVGGTFDFIGMSAAALTGSTVGAGFTAAQRTNPFSSFDGMLFEGGSLQAVVTGLRLGLNNNRSLQAVVGADTSPDVFEGQAMVEGELSLLFENATMFNKFVNETESTLFLRMLDTAGTGFIALTIPRLKYIGGEMDPPQEGPVPLRMPFRGLEHATYGTSLTLQRSNS